MTYKAEALIRMATSGKWIQHLQLLQLSGEHIAIEITEGLLLDAHESVSAIYAIAKKRHSDCH